MHNLKQATIILIGISLLVGFIIAGFAWNMNTKTEWNRLSNQIQSQQTAQEAFHDELWSTISGIAQVDKANDTLYTAYTTSWEVAVSRSSSLTQAAGQVFPMLFQQAGLSAPQMEIKQKLIQVIDDKNSEFTLVRQNLTVACTAFNDFVGNSWNQLILPTHMEQPRDCSSLIITSTRSKNAARTGVDDNKSIY